MLDSSQCFRYATWAHELSHVYQNRRLGSATFLKRYLAESAKKRYEEISFEVEAKAVAELRPACGVAS
jgi:hypothetical protein